MNTRPWDEKPFTLINWWDMQEFAASRFYAIGSLLERVQCRITKELDVETLVERDSPATLSLLESIEIDAKAICLRVSVECCEDLIASVKRGITIKAFIRDLEELSRTIRREMKNEYFLHLNAQSANWYQKPLEGWDEALSRWSKIKVDIEESGKCYACDRFAAAIFHVLLVAEFGVIELARVLKQEGDRPGWAAADRLQRILEKGYKDRSRLERRHSALLNNVMPLLLSIKDSWRHKINHVDNRLIWLDSDFSPRVAEEIIFATRGFMRRLASDLPQQLSGI
jgi:hypothetical protein